LTIKHGSEQDRKRIFWGITAHPRKEGRKEGNHLKLQRTQRALLHTASAHGLGSPAKKERKNE
jgi:hypothetical protein